MRTILLCITLLSIVFMTTAMAPATSFYDFTMKSIVGKDVKLRDYKGKVLLVVNVASECGYTPQYEGLEKLYEKYKDQGLMILGFPANNYGGQEPGTNEQIQHFCTSKFGVTFDMFSKISVHGDDIHPLYKFLTDGGGNSALAGEVKWNFEKFLINKDGQLIKRYRHKLDPMNEEILHDIEAALK